MIVRLWPLMIGVALVAGACTTAADPTTTPAVVTTVPAVAGSSTSVPAEDETTSTSGVPVETTLPPGTESLPLEMRQDIAALIGITQEVRGLQFLEPPAITVVSDAELAERVREAIQEDAEEIPADEALLQLLGLLDPEIDLLQLYTDLYGEQVAGFYDGDTGELVVPSSAEAFSALEKATLVHELTHALTDQRFGFNDAYESLIDAERFDEAVALLSVVEGDATLTEILYIQRLGLSEQQEVLRESFSADSTVFDSAPRYLQNSLIFPYREGLAFVQRLFELGGFDEVNRAYVEPPVSSEQIITPRDYQRDVPLAVRASEPTLSGYEVAFRSVWGELGFELMFDQALGGDPEASDGWGGDAYIQWFDGMEAALLIEYVGDSPEDAVELEDALVRYALAVMAVGGPVDEGQGRVLVGEDFAFVGRFEDRVVFIAAGDPDIGRLILDSVSDG